MKSNIRIPKKRSYLFAVKFNNKQSRYDRNIQKKLLDAYLAGFDFVKLHNRTITIAAWS